MMPPKCSDTAVTSRPRLSSSYGRPGATNSRPGTNSGSRPTTTTTQSGGSRPGTGDLLALDEKLAKMLAQRRAELQEQQQRHVVEYVPRVAKYQRPLSQNQRVRPAAVDTGKRKPRSTSPPPQTSGTTQLQSSSSAPIGSVVSEAASRRKQLGESFNSVKATSAYDTVFPALLSPFRRKMPERLLAPSRSSTYNISNHHHHTRSYSPPQLDHQQQSAVITLSASANRFSVVRDNSPPRERPSTGPKPFYPSGSQAAVHRAFNRM